MLILEMVVSVTLDVLIPIRCDEISLPGMFLLFSCVDFVLSVMNAKEVCYSPDENHPIVLCGFLVT